MLPLATAATAIFIYFILNPSLFVFVPCLPRTIPTVKEAQWVESVINKTAQQQQSEAGSRAGPPSQLGYRTRTHNQCSGGKTSEHSTCSPVIQIISGIRKGIKVIIPLQSRVWAQDVVVVSERMCYGWLERKKWKPDVGQQQQSEVWLRSLFTTAQQLRGQRIIIRFSDKKC